MIETLEPWHNWYPEHVTPVLPLPHKTLTEAWTSRVESDPGSTALQYFDTPYSASSVEDSANALAVGLIKRGVTLGDVVGIQLQNIPQFPLLLLALWRLGAIPLLLNPMYKARELAFILADARPVGIFGDCEHIEEIKLALGDASATWIMTTCQFQAGDSHPQPPEELAKPAQGVCHANDLFTLIEHFRGMKPPDVKLSSGTPALLTYTSGTTGDPKGALSTHANLLATAEATRQWFDLRPRERVLAIAPFFHISGALTTAIVALLAGAELICIGRPSPEQILHAISRYKVHHAAAAITAFNGLLALPTGGPQELRSLRTVFSGGAPVPPKTVERFAERFGHYIRAAFGRPRPRAAAYRCRSDTQHLFTNPRVPSPWVCQCRRRRCVRVEKTESLYQREFPVNSKSAALG